METIGMNDETGLRSSRRCRTGFADKVAELYHLTDSLKRSSGKECAVPNLIFLSIQSKNTTGSMHLDTMERLLAMHAQTALLAHQATAEAVVTPVLWFLWSVLETCWTTVMLDAAQALETQELIEELWRL